MKKFAVSLTLLMAMGISAIPTIAASPTTLAYPATRQVAYDESTVVKNFIVAQEARKGYLEELYNKGLITKELYDLNIDNIQAAIDYVEENGLNAPYGGYGRGYGLGGCCGGFGMGL